jgi:signal transduction histidine kinase
MCDSLMTVPFGKFRDDRGKQERWLRKLLFLTTAGFVLSAWVAVHAGGQAPDRGPSQRVLVLYSDDRLLPANLIVDRAINAVFTTDSRRFELHSESLDVVRFPGEEQRQRQRVFLREKYRERPPDLLIAVSGSAFAFLTERRAELFATAPIVYCSIAGGSRPEHLSDAGVADIPVPDTAGRTLEMMLRLHPDTRRVAVVSGSGPIDRKYADVFREGLATFVNRVAVTWLANLSMEQLRSEVSRLPDHTLVLYLTMYQDAAGETFTPRQALDTFAPASRVPIYGHYETYVGHGIVGGSIVTFEDIGRKAAELGIRILAGEDPHTAARSASYQPVPIFDWRQLRQWKIDNAHLPLFSVVRFKQDTYWERYRRIIVTTLSLIVLQGLWIAALLVQRTRRQRAEREHRKADQSLQRVTGRLLLLQEDERRRVAAELHDGLGQSLAIIKNRATICLRSTSDREQVHEQLDEIVSTATSAIEEVREIAHNLRPYELDRLGLVAAIESMIGRVADSTSINLSTGLERVDGLLSLEAETSVYRIVQEGLNNVVKHSHATAARVDIKRTGTQLVITVQDNGSGMSPSAAVHNGQNRGFGLTGISERVRLLGGSHTIDSAPECGTRLTVRLESSHAVAG